MTLNRTQSSLYSPGTPRPITTFGIPSAPGAAQTVGTDPLGDPEFPGILSWD